LLLIKCRKKKLNAFFFGFSGSFLRSSFLFFSFGFAAFSFFFSVYIQRAGKFCGLGKPEWEKKAKYILYRFWSFKKPINNNPKIKQNRKMKRERKKEKKEKQKGREKDVAPTWAFLFLARVREVDKTGKRPKKARAPQPRVTMTCRVHVAR
jgi:glycosyltransferase involved in cell wall biosynthesis